MLSSLFAKPMNIPDAKDALPGRISAIMIRNLMRYMAGRLFRLFRMEWKRFWLEWDVSGGLNGYSGQWMVYGQPRLDMLVGSTPNPTYEEVCSGLTGHTEIVEVVYDPEVISLDDILRCFWQEHNPTQGMRQGNDRGTQYRSAIYWSTDEQMEIVKGIQSALCQPASQKGFARHYDRNWGS